MSGNEILKSSNKGHYFYKCVKIDVQQLMDSRYYNHLFIATGFYGPNDFTAKLSLFNSQRSWITKVR